MKTNNGLVKYAKAQLGLPYWYGTFGQEATADLYEYKQKQYPRYYKSWDDFPSQYGMGIKTWVSFEPVTDADQFFKELHLISGIADKIKIGKLNYRHTEIDWAEFGRKAEELCKSLGLDYYIKDSLRAEMEKEEERKR